MHAHVQLPNNVVARPGVGSSGERVQVLANHFKVEFNPAQMVWQCDVDIQRVRAPPREGPAAGEQQGGSPVAA